MNRTGQRGPGSLMALTLVIAALLATAIPPEISGATEQLTPAAVSLLIGVQSDIQPDTEPAIRRREIALMQQSGIHWVRIVLNWYAAEPRKGEYNEEYLRGLNRITWTF